MKLRDVATALPFAHLLGLAVPPAPAALTGVPAGAAQAAEGGAPADPTAHLQGLPAQQQDAQQQDAPQDPPAPEAQQQPAQQADEPPPAPAADPVAAERARTAAILGAARPGMERLAQLAVAEGFSAELFARVQDAVPASAAGQQPPRRSLDERMQGAPNPQPGPGAPPAPQGADATQAAAAASILASARRARGEQA